MLSQYLVHGVQFLFSYFFAFHFFLDFVDVLCTSHTILSSSEECMLPLNNTFLKFYQEVRLRDVYRLEFVSNV